MVDSKEIFALRKQGKLDIAEKMARELLLQNPQDEWAQRALGWVLYDLSKRCLENNDHLSAKKYYNELKELSITEKDEMLAKSITHLNEDNTKGWEIQKQIKKLLDDNAPATQIVSLLRNYAKLNTDKPSLLHSTILSYANKIFDNFQSYFDFVKWWDLNNLTSDDYQTKTDPTSEKSYGSRAEKTFINIAKSIEEKELYGEIDWILPYLDKAIIYFKNDIWLQYHKGKLLILSKQKTEARKFLLPIVRIKNTEPWSWAMIAESFVDSDTEKAVASFCRALKIGHDDKFLTNYRVSLASLLIYKKEFEAAKFEIESVINLKIQLNQKIPDEIQKWQNEPWYESVVLKNSNLDFYELYDDIAEEILLDDLPWNIGVVDNVNLIKKICHIIFSDSKDALLYMEEWHEKEPIEVGLFIKAKLSQTPKGWRILSCAPTRESPAEDIYQHFEGVFSLPAHIENNLSEEENLENKNDVFISTFGFVKRSRSSGDVYVSNYLVEKQHVVRGKMINGFAIFTKKKDKNGREKRGWTALDCKVIE